jgi:hypothetical protein
MLVINNAYNLNAAPATVFEVYVASVSLVYVVRNPSFGLCKASLYLPQLCSINPAAAIFMSYI